MLLRTALRLSVLLALLAVPGDALAAGVVRTFSVTGTVTVPAAGARTLSLQCPSGAVALNGAVTRRGGGVAVRRSVPGKASGNWAFRVAAQGAGSRSVSAVVRCVALRLPTGFTAARLDVSSRNRSLVEIAPGAAVSTSLGCGRAWTATGYALHAGANGAVRIAGAVPDVHGWAFTLENTGATAVRAGVAVRCVRSRILATKPNGDTAELRFGVTRPSRSNTVGAGRPAFTHSCGAGRFSLATGSSLDPAASIELALSSPAGPNDGRWRFRRASGGDRVRTFLVCLSRASRFR
jgi:hypothetical protein